MDWNRSNANGAVAPPHSQQYLLPSTSSMAANGQSQSSMQQNFVQNGQYRANEPLLQHLLKAKNEDDYLKLQQAAMGNHRRSNPLTNQHKSNISNTSYMPSQDSRTIPDNRNAISVQNPVGSNYIMPAIANTVHQMQQPTSTTVGQQFCGNGYNPNGVQQQPLQNSQALQNYQPGVTYTYTHQNNIYTSARPPVNAVQMPCQQMAPNVPSKQMYNFQNIPNASAPMQDCRNSQKNKSSSLTNYRSVASKISHAPQQQMSVAQLQTFPQVDGNANCYGQSQQRQTVQNAMVNNSPPTLSAATKMPPPYTEARTNHQNVFSTSMNQNLSNQRQNYVVPSVQQPAQTGNIPSDQSSLTDEQSRIRDLIASHERKQNMMKLLLVYRNVKRKYELLNQENNLLRQRLQAGGSQENAEPPSLLTNLPTAQPQQNCIVSGQQNVTQTMTVPNSAQINSVRDFQGQNAYDNVLNVQNQDGVQHDLMENVAILNQMYKTDKGNCLGQNNYSVFDGGQVNVANGSTSLQPMSKATLTTNVGQETSGEFVMQANPNNQYTSTPGANNRLVLQNGNDLHSIDQPVSVSGSLNSARPENNSYENLSSLKGNGLQASVSREAIEASLPLWKTALQNSSQSANRSSETQQNHSLADSSLAAFSLLDDIMSTNEISSTIPAPKQDSGIPNPQIAIVSPLVQSKEALYEDYKLSKNNLQGPAIDNSAINGLMNSRDSECLNKILSVLGNMGANPIDNGSSSPKDSSQDNANFSSSGAEASQTQLKMLNDDIEIVDDSLQISGICTLVQGNSFYDSSIASMFDTSDTKASPCTDTTVDHSKTVHTDSISKAPCSTSPKGATVEMKSEPVDTDQVANGQTVQSDEHCSGIDIQDDQQMGSAHQESLCEVEFGAVCDQLTELLTEFPYGIENMFERKNRPSARITDEPALTVSAAIEDFQPLDDGKAVGGTQFEMVPDPSMNLHNVVEMVSEPLMDSGPTSEELPVDVPQKSEEIPISDQAVGGSLIPAICTYSDEAFEMISHSPVSNIQITLLDQDEIPKIFPEEKEHVDSAKCKEIKLEVQECSNTEEPEMVHQSPKKESTGVTAAGTDKNLFCCLFSWLTHTNSNAPKCNCKQAESITLLNNDTVKFPLSPQPSPVSLPKTNTGSNVGFEPADAPPHLDLVDSAHEEYRQPLDKPPKLEPMVSEPVCTQKSSFSPQRESPLKRSTSTENLKSVKDLLINKIVNRNVTPQAERVFKRSTSVDNFQPTINSSVKPNPGERKTLLPSPRNEEPAYSNITYQSEQKLKHGFRKSEKLIVKTDFLMTKFPYKERRRSKEKDQPNVAQSVSNNSEYQKNLPRPQEEERVEIRNEHSPNQQGDISLKRQKSSPDVDRPTRRRGRKRKERETHFEKTRKVPTVQEYLERKRELCKKRTDTRTDPSEGLGNLSPTVERPEMSATSPLTNKRPLSPSKTNVTPKENRKSKTLKDFFQKDRQQGEGPHEGGHRQRRDSKRVPDNKTPNLNRVSSKGKIYLSPCVASRRASYEGINLAKLQIRHSPDKPKYSDRRKSLESAAQAKPSDEAMKNNSPKMLEFKLYPELSHGSPNPQDKAGDGTDRKAKSVVEGIKSSKAAWCNSIPLKKRKVDIAEGKGFHKLPASPVATPNYKPLEKKSARPPQDSQTTFNVFKQMYHEKRSKSVDCSQSNS